MTSEILAILSSLLGPLSRVLLPSEYDELVKRIDAARETYDAQKVKLLAAVLNGDAASVNAIISSLL